MQDDLYLTVLETIEDDLVVTVNRLACVSPRIRYNLRDLTRIVGSDRCACGNSPYAGRARHQT